MSTLSVRRTRRRRIDDKRGREESSRGVPWSGRATLEGGRSGLTRVGTTNR